MNRWEAKRAVLLDQRRPPGRPTAKDRIQGLAMFVGAFALVALSVSAVCWAVAR